MLLTDFLAKAVFDALWDRVKQPEQPSPDRFTNWMSYVSSLIRFNLWSSFNSSVTQPGVNVGGEALSQAVYIDGGTSSTLFSPADGGAQVLNVDLGHHEHQHAATLLPNV